MATKKRTVKKKKASKKGIVGVVALAAAAAAGTYFLYGSKQAAKNRKKVKGWMLKAKGEVLEKMEKMKDINEDDYRQIVDTVVKKYKKLKTVNAKEVEGLAEELKKKWKEIHRDVSGRSPGRGVKSARAKSKTKC